jgi:hypothetical protein
VVNFTLRSLFLRKTAPIATTQIRPHRIQSVCQLRCSGIISEKQIAQFVEESSCVCTEYPEIILEELQKNITRGNRCSGLKVNTVQQICPADRYARSQECQYQQTHCNYLRLTNNLHLVFKFRIAFYTSPLVRKINHFSLQI